jgi:site-specific DNA recombinase
MSPSHAAKKEWRWRYYVSQAILQGRNDEAGSVGRVPAIEIERSVAEAVRGASPVSDGQPSNGSLPGQHKIGGKTSSGLAAMRRGALENLANLRTIVERVVISRTSIEIELAEGWSRRIRIASKLFPGRRHRRIDAVRSSKVRVSNLPGCGR